MLQAIALGIRGVLAPSVSPANIGSDALETDPRSALARLRGFLELALLDTGDETELQAAVTHLGVADLIPLRVWTHRLGHAARPPRPLAFRWLSNRWGVLPSECLYVPGTEDLAAAARRAGWCVMPRPTSGLPDLDTLVDRLDAGGRPWEA